jgi:hypothetical protein
MGQKASAMGHDAVHEDALTREDGSDADLVEIMAESRRPRSSDHK